MNIIRLFTSHIFLLTILFSCGSEVNKTDFSSDCLRMPRSTEESYFPEKAFDDTSSYKGQTEFLSNWYSGHLYSMNEPIIFECTETSECYRFTWLRSFHEAIAIRLTRDMNTIKLDWKMTNGAGGYEPGELIEQGTKLLSVSELTVFKTKLNNCHFFELPTNEISMVNDGAQWILEGVNQSNSYHLVDRLGASETSFGEVCLYLLGLSEIEIPEELIY